MSLLSTLNISSQTLLQNQKAINITNDNISNLNTDGYNKIDISFANLPTGGAYIQNAQRVYDGFIFNRLINTNQDKSYNETLDTGIYQLETLFNDINGSGISNALDNYYQSINDIITNPDDIAARNTFLNSAKMLIGRVRNISDSLDDINKNSRKYLDDAATRINDILSKLSTINQNILKNKNNQVELNNYLDERDRSIKELSSLIDIDVRYNSNETVDIFSVKGHMLLSYDKIQEVSHKTNQEILSNSFTIKPASTVSDPTSSITDSGTLKINYKKDGKDLNLAVDYTNKSLLDIANEINNSSDLKATIVNVGNDSADFRLVVTTRYADSKPNFITSIEDSDSDDTKGFDISSTNTKEIYSKKVEISNFYIGSANLTDYFQKGKVGALIKTEKITNETTINFDQLIQDFVYQNNSIHRLGFNLEGNSGISLFKNEFGSDIYGIDASNIALAFEEPEKVAVAKTKDNNADNEIANMLLLTKDKKNGYKDSLGTLHTFTQPAYLEDLSFSEFYRTKIVTPIATEGQYNKDRLNDNTFLYNALEDKISEMSGVNLDEELIKLSKLQRSYEASARVITVTDELLQTVMGLVK